MLVHVRQVLTPDELRVAGRILADAAWGDGRATAGEQPAQAKNNQQLPESGAAAQQLRQLVLAGLGRHALFFSAALPKQISPPMFNRYGGDANSFGNHVDSAVRYLPGGSGRVRTDVPCTLFLAEPGDYGRRRTGDRGHLRPAGNQAAGRRHGAVPRAQRAPGRTGHARAARGQLLK